MIKAVFRVDSSIQMGSGHVMRCLTLAEQLSENKYQVIFICREHKGNLIEMIESKGYEVKKLKDPTSYSQKGIDELPHAKWLGVSQFIDSKETLKAINDVDTIDLLVIDHYALDERWESQFRHLAKKILVIDDLADRKHHCDILLDQNYYLNMDKRYEDLVPKECKLLLGPQHVLLRKEFIEARKNAQVRTGPVKRIFVFFGGSDPTNETTKALKAIQMLQREDIIVDVVVGGSNPHQEEVKKLADSMKNVYYHFQISNMAELMLKADLAIGAGGSTTWERCCLGLPAITIILAENQREIINSTSKYGALNSLGDGCNINEEILIKSIIELINEKERLKSMSQQALKLVDVSSNMLVIGRFF